MKSDFIEQFKSKNVAIPVTGEMTATVKIKGAEDVDFRASSINVYKGAYYCVSGKFVNSDGEHLIDICVLSGLEGGDHKIGAQDKKVIAAYAGEVVHGVASSGELRKFEWVVGKSMSGDFDFECVDGDMEVVFSVSGGAFDVRGVPTV